MSWAEIKPKLGNLANGLESNGWPEPTDPDFWKWVYKEEALLVIANQLPKYVSEDSNAGIVVAKSHLMIFDIGSPASEQEARKLVEDGTIFKGDFIDTYLDGSLASALFDHLGIPKHNQALYLPDLKKKNGNIVEKLGSSSEPIKAIAWWALWGDVYHQHQRSQSEYSSLDGPVMTPAEGVDFIVNELKLSPPLIR